MKYKIDLMTTSSSRYWLLPYVIEGFNKYIASQCYADIRYLLHEDCIIPDNSKIILDWAKDYYDVIEYHNPHIGLGPSMDYMFKNHVKSKYMFYLQDDWEFERTGIDLDRILWTMDRNPEINLVLFHHHNILKRGMRDNNCKELKYFDDFPYFPHFRWCFTPGIWRMDFAMKYWVVSPKQEVAYRHQFRKSHGLSIEEQGVYFYGTYYNDPRYYRNLGVSCSTGPREPRKTNQKLGGSLEIEKKYYNRKNSARNMNIRAPWLPKLEERPVYARDEKEQNIDEFDRVIVHNTK